MATRADIERTEEVARRARERSDDLLKRINQRLIQGLRDLGKKIDDAEGLEDEIQATREADEESD